MLICLISLVLIGYSMSYKRKCDPSTVLLSVEFGGNSIAGATVQTLASNDAIAAIWQRIYLGYLGLFFCAVGRRGAVSSIFMYSQ